LHPGQISADEVLLQIRTPASQALETPSTATIDILTVGDSQLASSKDQPFYEFNNGIVESKCGSKQKFISEVCFSRALDAKLTDLGGLYSSN
jgi:hypothetical protein